MRRLRLSRRTGPTRRWRLFHLIRRTGPTRRMRLSRPKRRTRPIPGRARGAGGTCRAVVVAMVAADGRVPEPAISERAMPSAVPAAVTTTRSASIVAPSMRGGRMPTSACLCIGPIVVSDAPGSITLPGGQNLHQTANL